MSSETKKYKSSRFNFVYCKDSEAVVFNTFTKACTWVDENTLQLLNGERDCSEDESDIEDLMNCGFLVRESFDEIAYLKYHYQRARFDSDYLSVTVAPTLSCNFDCPYCFEKKRPGVMNEEVQQRVLEFIDEKLEGGIKRLDMTWYGGEPLLCFSIIERMCEHILSSCNRFGTACKMGLITNGYLLDEVSVSAIERLGISLQVTLDGMRDNHDERRYLVGGGATFDCILDNLRLLKGRAIDVYVRMNIDAGNLNDYEALHETLEAIGNERMVLYPSVAEDVNERIADRKSLYLSSRSYDDFVSSTRNKGFFDDRTERVPISNDVSRIPDERTYFCAAELENSYVIDEIGNVYKCWNEIGRNHPCFNLVDIEDVDFESLLSYMDDGPFDDEVCTDCTFLPICYGGCRYHKVNFNQRYCAYSAESVRSYIDDVLLTEGGE